MSHRMPEDEPCYTISVASSIVGIHAQTLRYYERMGIIAPSRSKGNRRLYSPKDVATIRRVKTLMNDLGVNLAGVEVILNLLKRLSEVEQGIESIGGSPVSNRLLSESNTLTD